MDHLQPPKNFDWTPQLSPRYTCKYDLLVTSGCSFTASTQQTNSAASWPGYAKDRCGLNHCIDMSYPGAGNFYIKDSIIYALDNLVPNTNPLVVVMWSGLDRTEEISLYDNHGPVIENNCYNRVEPHDTATGHAKTSLEHMLNLSTYLHNKKIDHMFTTFVNLTEYPFIPVRDTTPRFYGNLDKSDLEKLNNLPWIASGNDCLYEWAFFNEYLEEEDYFHPPVDANLRWTDEILLPCLAKEGVIVEI